MNLKIVEQILGLFVIFLALISIPSCNSTKSISLNDSYSADSSITVDGIYSDWKMPLVQPSEYTNIQYKIGNDAENLYICVRIPDKMIQRRIMGMGMSVFVDTLAKRRDKIGIGFPLALTEEQVQIISFEAQKDGPKIDDRALDKAYAAICQEFELLGFIEEDETEKIRVSNLASRNLKTALGFDHFSAMVCEFKIPLSQLFKGTIQYNEVISIGIRVNPTAANADDDPGLFDDPNNNAITGSGQAPNPMMNGQQQQPGTVSRQPSRSNNNNMTGIWIKTTLVK
jgi:hypothetical protein